MAQKELPDEGPSLEMPSLGSLFKRGRKKPTKEESRRNADQEPSAEDFERLVRGPRDEDPSASAEPSVDDEVTTDDESAPIEAPAAVDEPAPVDEPAAVEEPAVADAPSPVDEPAAVEGVLDKDVAEEDPAEIAHVADPVETPAPDAAAAPESAPEPEEISEPEPAVEQTVVRGLPPVEAEIPAEEPADTAEQPSPAPAPVEAEETEVLPELPEHDMIAEAEEPDLGDIEEDEVEKTAVAAFKPIPPAPEKPRPRDGARAVRPTAVSSTKDAEPVQDDEASEEAPTRAPRTFTLPAIPSIAAAGVTGVLIGILAVALTYFGLRGCEAVRGTSTCGGPGIQILIVNMIILVVVGSMLLKAWKATDPTSTSFLAVGLLAVISLLFLIEVIFSSAMVVVIPLVAAGTYALSQWVTERFIEEE